ERFDTSGIERLALVGDLHAGDALTQIGQLGDTLLHVFTSTEHTEIVLHAALQLFAQRGDVFASGTLVEAGKAVERRIQIGLGSAPMLGTSLQYLLKVQSSVTANHHLVEQRVDTQAVGTLNRFASHCANREQASDDHVVAIGIQGDRLTMNVGG